MSSITKEACYLSLKEHRDTFKTYSLRRLFEEDSKRVERFSKELDSFYIDYSKNHITPETMRMLNEFAADRQLPQAINQLFAGEFVNNTEARPALHSALRFQGEPSTPEQKSAASVREKMAACVNKLHAQQWLGYTNKPINTVVNIGIGGSDLGPRMVAQALSAYQQKQIKVHFVANIDGADLCDTLATCDPETTLFIVASKTFTTLETLENAQSAKHWLLKNGITETQLKQHFIAISTNITAAKVFGVAEENIFPIWDWVGGRYSLWSAIGLPIAIAIGMDNFNQLLAGAHAMDKHYQESAIADNIPATAALISFWYSHFWQVKAHAVLPYAQRLSRLPSHLQQLDMESLGKSVTTNGANIDYSTGNIIWGTEGTNGQHSFHQLLHQGSEIIPVDFIMVNQSMSELSHQHTYLQACCISQSQALLKGKTLADAEKELRSQGTNDDDIKALAPHKVVKGNKPSNTILLEQLDPKNLGMLIAFYEHKVHALGVLLNINPFDQWGVELGKQLGKPVHKALCGESADNNWDESTISLIAKLSTIN